MYKMQENTVVYRHIKGVKGTGVLTLAMYVLGNKLQYGYAACAEKDQFSKEIGRDLSRDRLEEKLDARIPMLSKGSGTLDNTIHRVLCHIYAHGEYPKHIESTIVVNLRNQFYFLA